MLAQQRAEIERESARLALIIIKQLIKALEVARREEIEAGKQPLVAQLIPLRAIGIKGAWLLDKELFGWRRFANRARARRAAWGWSSSPRTSDAGIGPR